MTFPAPSPTLLRIMFRDPSTGELVNSLQGLRYTHEAMVNVILMNPGIKQNDIAAMFDRSPAWVSTIINSDSFQARLEERRKELEDPAIVASIEERLRALASASLERVLQRVTDQVDVNGRAAMSDENLISATKVATAALGYGARQAGTGGPSVQLVINVPGKISDPDQWARTHTPPPVQLVETR